MELPPPFRAFEIWQRQLATELMRLPWTLTEFREGAENFRKVTQRLLDATVGLEQFSEMQANASEFRRRVDDVTRAVRDQLGSMPGGERMMGPLEDLNSTLAAMARLNPFLPPGSRRPPN